jgi:hypothetical protein
MTQPINQIRISLGQLNTQQDVAQLVKHLQTLYTGQINQIVSTAAPNTAPSKIGAEYINTTTGKIYKAIGNSKVSDWTLLN